MDEKLNSLYKSIGSRIREARLKQNMSQQELAERANISLPQISVIECGKSKMYLDTFVRIAEALQISTDDLIRPDIPEVKVLFSKEFSDLLSDCTPTQIDSIMRIAAEVKHTMKMKTEDEDY